MGSVVICSLTRSMRPSIVASKAACAGVKNPLGNPAFLTVGLPAVSPPDPNGVVVLHMSKI